MEVLELAKAFAGPVATIIAAIAAVSVTYHFGKQQVRIAQAQAATATAQKDIAYDRLKYDLFEKRYEIYLAAKELIDHVRQLRTLPDMLDQSSFELRVKLRVRLIEARFFFPPTETELFRKIAQLAATYQAAVLTPIAPNESPATKAEVEKAATDSLGELVQIYEKLPELLEKELGFAQLTSRE